MNKQDQKAVVLRLGGVKSVLDPYYEQIEKMLILEGKSRKQVYEWLKKKKKVKISMSGFETYIYRRRSSGDLHKKLKHFKTIHQKDLLTLTDSVIHNKEKGGILKKCLESLFFITFIKKLKKN